MRPPAPHTDCCPTCGEHNPKGSLFCRACGRALPQMVQPGPKSKQPTPVADPQEPPAYLCSCGRQCPGSLKNCDSCGAPLSSAITLRNAPKPDLCQRCRQPLKPRFEVCLECGKLQQPDWLEATCSKVLMQGIAIAVTIVGLGIYHYSFTQVFDPAGGLRLMLRKWLGI